MYVKLPQALSSDRSNSVNQANSIFLRSLDKTKWFFDLKDDIKESCAANNYNSKGYYMYQGVATGEEASIGLTPQIEAFLIANPLVKNNYEELKKDYVQKLCQRDSNVDVTFLKSFYTPWNQWPIDEEIPDELQDFKKTITNCYSTMSVLSKLILEAMAISLDLPVDLFASKHDKLDCTLELKHYQPHRNSKSSDDIMDLFKQLKANHLKSELSMLNCEIEIYRR